MPQIMNISPEDIDTQEKCRNYTISIIECNKIGVPYACLFAEAGFKVVGISTDPHTLKLLKEGRTPFLKTAHALEKYARGGVFTASSDVRKAVAESDVIVTATPASVDAKKKPDYSLLEKTCKEVGMGLKKGSLVLFISTTGPGVVEGQMRDVLEKTSGLKAGVDFGLALSPEQPRKANESSKGSRIVSAINEPSLRVTTLVLGRVTQGEVVSISRMKAAEALNLFQNVNSEVSSALANELAFLCEKLGIDFLEVLRAAEKSSTFILPSPGVDQGPVRKDFYLLAEEAENVGFNPRLTLLARRINEEIAEHTLRLVRDALKASGKTVRRAKVSFLGVSRLPDAKEPPGQLTRKIINLFKRKVRTVQVYDPFFSQKELKDLGFNAERLSKVVEGTDCIIILRGHSKFARLNLRKIRLLAKKSPAIVDISHIIDPVKAEKHGFVYRGLGRGVWTK